MPQPPAGVEVLALVKRARERLGRVFEWDARLESSCIAVLSYLYRRAYGEHWAGRGGSGRFGCSVAQLVMGLAPIMGWGGLPNRGRLPRDEYAREREAFVERHRASVRRWLDWLELAGLLSHTPQQDEEGVWWRTIIELHPAPEIERELLEAAVDRRAGLAWPGAPQAVSGAQKGSDGDPAPGAAHAGREARQGDRASAAGGGVRGAPAGGRGGGGEPCVGG